MNHAGSYVINVKSQCKMCFLSEFAHLVEEFRRFKLQQAQAADCNSHGTFEWVDGMLVQALQSGDWLLMDNVNFCK